LNAEIEKVLATRPSAEWIEVLNAAGVPSGPILNVQEVFDNEQVRHLGLAQTVRHPARGELTIQGLPAVLSRTPGGVRTPAPDAGEHTDAILAELGYDAEEVAHLKKDGVV